LSYDLLSYAVYHVHSSSNTISVVLRTNSMDMDGALEILLSGADEAPSSSATAAGSTTSGLDHMDVSLVSDQIFNAIERNDLIAVDDLIRTHATCIFIENSVRGLLLPHFCTTDDEPGTC
jgi:hypothetical protein